MPSSRWWPPAGWTIGTAGATTATAPSPRPSALATSVREFTGRRIWMPPAPGATYPSTATYGGRPLTPTGLLTSPAVGLTKIGMAGPGSATTPGVGLPITTDAGSTTASDGAGTPV